MKRYLKYVKPYWPFFLLSPLLMLIEVYCDVKIPSIAAQIINQGVSNSDTSVIYSLTAQMLFYVVFAILGGVGASFAASRASAYFSRDLRLDMFKKIQEFSFKNIDNFTTGSLVTRLTNDVTQLQQFIVLLLRMCFRAPGMLIGAIIMAYLINPGISVIYVATVPFLSLIIFCVLYFSYSKFSALQQRIDALNTKVREILSGIRVVKGFAKEKEEDSNFKTVNNELRDSSLSAYRITIWQLPLMTIVVNIATIAILWTASIALDLGDIEIGDVSALITYSTQMLSSVALIAMVFLQSSRAVVSSGRIKEVLNAEVDILSSEAESGSKKVESGDISFQNVYFKYFENGKENVLDNISFEIKSGETVGIIGSTGCGKSSLVNLISRLYDVTGGKVLVDGLDVRDYSLDNLRNGVGMVLQSNVLFSGTIKENLLWGDKFASDEKIANACRNAGAEEFIKQKKDGYNDIVHQGGVNLSGGQKQRLCIARALLKEPKVLILDDSTSAVDMATEGEILKHLKTYLSDTTKIIIAQRISSVSSADKIIVLSEGKLEAIGTHSELLEKSQTYFEIYSSQSGKKEV